MFMLLGSANVALRQREFKEKNFCSCKDTVKAGRRAEQIGGRHLLHLCLTKSVKDACDSVRASPRHVPMVLELRFAF